jgi:hypothetical protein
VADDSHIVSVEEDLKEEVDLAATNRSDTELTINGVAESHTIGGVGEGDADDEVKEDGEESGSEYTTLTYTFVGEKGVRERTVGTHRGVCVGVEILEKTEDFGRDTGALADEPEGITIDVVVGL